MEVVVQWMEPTIQKRIDQVYEQTNNSERVILAEDEFESALMQLEKLLPNHMYLFEMLNEAVFAMRAAGEDVAYRVGLNDGLGVLKNSLTSNQVVMMRQ
ncbi:hypothetical protein [uncultured Brevibacillus sp.]|uniref:hypothetical protein n=1 Tax=uncultured Brevibacillus sp. TaxID=169970 RepID=UPI00259772E5|nr:hypothetical protein [uncultured Brevibacillus sp.]